MSLSTAYLIALLAVEMQPLVIGLLAFGIVAVLVGVVSLTLVKLLY